VLPGDGPGSIDPALTQPPNGWSILTMTNDGLVGFRRVGGVEGVQLVPDLAVSLPTPSDDGKTYTFRVRPDVHYSNGRLVQPADFRRAIERLFELPPGTATSYYFTGIEGAGRCKPGRRCDLSRGIATNRLARTVTFHLTVADADFLTKLAMPVAFAVPPDTPSRDVGRRPVPATGPYIIASYSTNGSVKLVRNPRFREWSAAAQPDGFPDVISLKAGNVVDAASADAEVRAIERGTADVAVSLVPPLPTTQLDRLATRYPSQLHVSPSAGTKYFFLNTRVPPFDDVRVRRAVNYAFDRPAFAQLLGRSAAPTCQILPPNFPSYRRSCPYLPGGVGGLSDRVGACAHRRARALHGLRARLARLPGAVESRACQFVLHAHPQPQGSRSNWVLRVAGRFSVGRQLHPRLVRLLRRVDLRRERVLQSLDRPPDGPCGGCPSSGSTGGGRALAEDRARDPRASADGAHLQPTDRRLRLEARRELQVPPAMGGIAGSALGQVTVLRAST
jgi:hypothetical protein